jgi:hypothetical protein
VLTPVTGIPLRIVDRPSPPAEPSRLLKLGRVFPGTGYLLDPGSMWREPESDMFARECWAIVLPNGRVWRTTDPASDPPHAPWDVTGEPPAVTVSPSINDTSERGGWHGWIRAGFLELA